MSRYRQTSRNVGEVGGCDGETSFIDREMPLCAGQTIRTVRERMICSKKKKKRFTQKQSVLVSSIILPRLVSAEQGLHRLTTLHQELGLTSLHLMRQASERTAHALYRSHDSSASL